jgi:hypothetical protein
MPDNRERLVEVGDSVFITGSSWTKRRWWELWKPRWTRGPVETKRYKVASVVRSRQRKTNPSSPSSPPR